MKTNESFDEKSKTHDSLNEARIEESPEKSKAEDSLSLSNILKGSKRSKGVLNECDSYDFRNSIP